jgi:hypothetical protein
MAGRRVKPENVIQTFKGLAYSSESNEAIEIYLTMAPQLPRFAYIRQFIIFHKMPLKDALIKKLADFPCLSLVNENPIVFQVNIYQKANKKSLEGVFVILPGSQPNISRLVTVSYTDFWAGAIKPLVRKIYPDGMPVFFRQDEIELALVELEKVYGSNYRVRIADVTSKEERPSRQDYVRKSYDTDRRWTDLSIPDVFAQAKERGQWFTGLRFVIQQKRKNLESYIHRGAGRLYKYGEISVDSHYQETTSALLASLEAHVSQRLILLEKRGIIERGYEPSKPIEILYDYDAFSRVEEVSRFGKVMLTYPNSTKAVFHSNPYYHASIADFLDGSSFDIWVLSANRVVIVPQAKSSTQGFERLISHIFSNFGEGTVNEYSSQ